MNTLCNSHHQSCHSTDGAGEVGSFTSKVRALIPLCKPTLWQEDEALDEQRRGQIPWLKMDADAKGSVSIILPQHTHVNSPTATSMLCLLAGYWLCWVSSGHWKTGWYSWRFAWLMHSLQGSCPLHQLVSSAEKKRHILYLMMNGSLLRCNEILNTSAHVFSVLQHDVEIIFHYEMFPCKSFFWRGPFWCAYMKNTAVYAGLIDVLQVFFWLEENVKILTSIQFIPRDTWNMRDCIQQITMNNMQLT